MEQQNLGIEDGSNDKRYFTLIPNYILNHSTLHDREVYIQMKRIAGEQGTCWTSRKTLAKQCGISIRRFDKSVDYLVNHKWIKLIGTKSISTKGGSQQVNEYKIMDLWNLNNEYYQSKGGALETLPNNKGGARNDSKVVHGIDKGGAPGAHKEDLFKNITIKKRENKFSPPSFDDVKSYCNERNNGVNPQSFIDFYESKGWLIGKNKMKSWQAAVRTWENREQKVGNSNDIEIPNYAKKYIR